MSSKQITLRLPEEVNEALNMMINSKRGLIS